MTRRWQTCVLGGVSIVLLATTVILIRQASAKYPGEQSAQARAPRRIRNLSLQPEALAVHRRLGERFKSGRERSVLSGNLIVGGNQQPVTIARRHTESGEVVEVLLASRRLTWSETEGTRAEDRATEAEHLLVERLVSDSPDQFVLAQLRGASYQTIFRNLRPTDAGDDYSGPLWTMVRVNDPQTAESLAPRSAWRLYYINSQSGLIDRIECEVDGQRIEASILQWTEQNGERVPSHIRWSASGQTLMEYQLSSFSRNQ